MSMNFQMLGNYWLKVPRPVFTIATTIAYAACAIGGRNMLYQIFKNFLPLIGYWIVIWLTIVIEQHIFFNRGREYDWTMWNNRQKLPIGIAAGIAFLVGWAGAIVGMDQTYFAGPLAKSAPGNCELGIWLGAGFTAVVYPPLRFLETRIIRR
ncbi:Vitamin B6 transporter [Elasticomyces elasticus]|nr:Vitamin B6 transporter [Elasticomyces elasticus]